MNLKVKRPKVEKLWLTPIIDMFVTVMIFLLISFSPDAAKIKKSRSVVLPKAENTMIARPNVQVEVARDYVKVNGEKLPGLIPEVDNPASWAPLKAKLDELSKGGEEPVLLIADKDTNYQFVDRAVGYMAATGYTKIYLLTHQLKKIK